MQKYVPYKLLLSLFLVASIAACSSSSGTTSSAPVAAYDLPKSFASYSSLPNTPRGGAVQWGAISTSAKFSNYSVSTLAGTAGTAGFGNYSGNSTTKALFNKPIDITTDGINFYVADYGNSVIRKVTPAGIVTTLHCTLLDGITPIGFNRPSGITTDGTNLYVADSGSNTIRVVEIATTKTTTVFPTAPSTAIVSNRVTAIIGSALGLAGSVDSTDSTAVLFNQPTGITTDGVNLYVTDFNNATVRWIDLKNKYAVYTLAGTSGASGSSDGIREAARFNLPGRITTDGKHLYLTDFYNRTIRRIEISSGTVTTIAGNPEPLGADDGTADGIGTSARFNQPNGITTDGANLYVTDSFQNTIRKIVIATGNVTTISGISGTNGIGGAVDSPGTPSFYSPSGITTDGTSLFVVEGFNNTIRKIR